MIFNDQFISVDVIFPVKVGIGKLLLSNSASKIPHNDAMFLLNPQKSKQQKQLQLWHLQVPSSISPYLFSPFL